jgi:flavorubredoxin
MTPQVNQWDSLMVYEETTGTLFPNDLFSSLGTEAVTDTDRSREALGAARELGYQPDDRKSLGQALDKLTPLGIKVIAPMHGPTLTAHTDDVLRAFRDNALAPA